MGTPRPPGSLRGQAVMMGTFQILCPGCVSRGQRQVYACTGRSPMLPPWAARHVRAPSRDGEDALESLFEYPLHDPNRGRSSRRGRLGAGHDARVTPSGDTVPAAQRPRWTSAPQGVQGDGQPASRQAPRPAPAGTRHSNPDDDTCGGRYAQRHLRPRFRLSRAAIT